MNSHNDLGCKTVARIHCQNEYSYINKFNYCINALITFSRTLINHSFGPKMPKFVFNIYV